jgi:hypothetical protein
MFVHKCFSPLSLFYDIIINIVLVIYNNNNNTKAGTTLAGYNNEAIG